MKKFIPLLLTFFIIIEMIAVIGGVNNGSIILNKTSYYSIIILSLLVILVFIVTFFVFHLYPKIKYKKYFQMIKNNKFDLLISEIKKLKLNNKNSDQFLILSLITQESIYNNSVFYDLVDKLNRKNYEFIKYFWLSIKAYDELKEKEFLEQVQSFKISQKFFNKSEIYSQILNFLEQNEKDELNYLVLKNKVKNKILMKVIDKKWNSFETL